MNKKVVKIITLIIVLILLIVGGIYFFKNYKIVSAGLGYIEKEENNTYIYAQGNDLTALYVFNSNDTCIDAIVSNMQDIIPE